MAPTGLVATAGDAYVDLTWNTVLGASQYNVKRGTSPSSLNPVASVRDAAAFKDLGLADSITYYYAVSAVNGQSGVESANSSVVSAMPFPPSPTLHLEAYPGDSFVWLTWNSVSTAVKYVLVRDGSSQPTYTNVPYFLDTSVVNGSSYSYTVYAFTSNGQSVSSGTIIVTPVGPPPTPRLISGVASGSSVSLAWNASPGATSYNLLRSTSSGTGYSLVASVNSPVTTYSDNVGPGNSVFYYVVQAVNAWGASSISNELSVTALSLQADSGSNYVWLTWDSVPGAAKYMVVRDGSNALAYTDVPYYLDTSVVNGVSHAYAVSAITSNGQSVSSGTVNAMAVGAPSAPYLVSVVASGTNVSVAWNPSPGASSYRLLRSTSSGSEYTLVASVNSPATTCSDAVDPAVSQVYYVLQAVNAWGASSYSNELAFPPVPGYPMAWIVPVLFGY